MGLVIDRTAQVLRLVLEHEPSALKHLCKWLGLKKPALCMMLQSMAKAGLLARLPDGAYYLGPLLFQLTGQVGDESALWHRVARRLGHQLACASDVAVTVALLENGQYVRLLLQADRPVSFQEDLSHPWPIFYHSATGRLLLAQGSSTFQAEVLRQYGLPPHSIWPEISTEADFKRELSRLKASGFAEVLTGNGQILYLGSALALHPSAPPAALGLGLPAKHFSGIQKEQLLATLGKVSRNAKVYGLKKEQENFFQ